VWLGTGVTVMSGVTIEDGAVVAANSHVVSNLPSYSLCGGNPATLIKFRFERPIINLLQQLKWWDLSTDSIKQIAPLLCTKPTIDLLLSLVTKYKT